MQMFSNIINIRSLTCRTQKHNSAYSRHAPPQKCNYTSCNADHNNSEWSSQQHCTGCTEHVLQCLHSFLLCNNFSNSNSCLTSISSIDSRSQGFYGTTIESPATRWWGFYGGVIAEEHRTAHKYKCSQQHRPLAQIKCRSINQTSEMKGLGQGGGQEQNSH